MLIVFTLGTSAHCHATAVRGSNNEAGIYIVGEVNCDEWINDHSHDLATASLEEYWLVGFLSGIAVGSKTDFMENTDPNSIFKLMDNYCSSHLTDSTANGANEIMNDLIIKMH